MTDAATAEGREQRAQRDFLEVGRAVLIFRRFPASSLVAVPYLFLFLPQALIFSNPQIRFILVTLGWALAGSLVVEIAALSRLRPAQSSLRTFTRSPTALYRLGLFAAVVGSAAGLLGASAGVGTVRTQITGAAVSSSATMLTIFASWTYIGVALLVSSYLGGRIDRRSLLTIVTLLVLGEAVRSYLTAITASLISFTVFAVLVLLYVGAVRVRHCITIAVFMLLIWPTLFSLRNDARISAGVRVSSSVSAYDRIRYDQQITEGARLPVGVDIGQPEGLELVRYGLVPRFIDPSRPPLTTGRRINQLLGGSDTSSYTFLPVATLYVLEGPWRTAFYYAGAALVLSLMLRAGSHVTPLRLVGLALIIQGVLGWLGTYPDNLIGTLQGAVAFLPIAVLVVLRHHTRQGRLDRGLDE